MSQRRRAALVVAALLFGGCAVRPEQTLIGDFFAASRLRDLTALARIGTVVFEPRERGTVTAFTIRSVQIQSGDGKVGAGEAAVKDVTVDASVRLPDGSTAARLLTVRLQRRFTAGRPDPAALYGGWIVTAVTDAVPAPASPPS